MKRNSGSPLEIAAPVAPRVGAWIETLELNDLGYCTKRSHPAWVRGLKLADTREELIYLGSHPAWVRGLKLL